MTKNEYIASCITKYNVAMKYPRVSMWYDLALVAEYSLFEIAQIAEKMRAAAFNVGSHELALEATRLEELALLFENDTLSDIVRLIEQVGGYMYAKDFLNFRVYCLSVWGTSDKINV